MTRRDRDRADEIYTFPVDLLMECLRTSRTDVQFSHHIDFQPGSIAEINVMARLASGGIAEVRFCFDMAHPNVVNTDYQQVIERVVEEFNHLLARLGESRDRTNTDLGLLGSQSGSQAIHSFVQSHSERRTEVARARVEEALRLGPENVLRSHFSSEAARDLEAVHGIRVDDSSAPSNANLSTAFGEGTHANGSNAIAFGQNDVAQPPRDADWQRAEMERLTQQIQARATSVPIGPATAPPVVFDTSAVRPGRIIQQNDEHQVLANMNIQQLVQRANGPLTEDERRILSEHMARLLGQDVPNPDRPAAGTFGGRRLEFDEQK